MSRDLSGNYTLPAGNPVVEGTEIDPAWANDTLDDLSAALTDSLSRSGKGAMSIPFLAVNGATGAPAYSFQNETSTGMLRPSAGTLQISVLNTPILNYTVALTTFNLPVLFNGLTDVANCLRVTATGGAQKLLIGNSDSVGATNPTGLYSYEGVLSVGKYTNWTGSGGAFTPLVDISAVSSTIKVRCSLRFNDDNFRADMSGGNCYLVTLANSWLMYDRTENSFHVDVLGARALSILSNGLRLQVGLYAKAATVASTTIDLTTGNLFYKTISANTAFAVSGVRSSGAVNSFVLEVVNAGAFTTTFAFSPKWPGGLTPTFTASGKDVLGFYSYDNGATWVGLMLGRDVR